MAKRALKAGKFKRISLNLTVPGKFSKKAWEHLLASIEKFEKVNSVAVVDLDMTSTPVASLR
jgi:hypothetical protein